MAKLYPPILEGKLPAQSGKVSGNDIIISIPFRLNRGTNWSDISAVTLRIKTIATGLQVTEGDISTAKQFVIPDERENDLYIAPFDIGSLLSSGKIKAGRYYKAQLAFIDTNNQVGYFSSVGVFKYTTDPVLEVDCNGYTCRGDYSQKGNGKDITEKVYYYQFDLYNADGSRLLATSEKQIHDSTTDPDSSSSFDIWQLNRALDPGNTYQIKYSVITSNELTPAPTVTKTFTYQALQSPFDNNFDIFLENDYENGCVHVKLPEGTVSSSGGTMMGFILSRTSSLENFEVWHEVFRFTLPINSNWPYELFTDYTVQQGVSYKYALQGYDGAQVTERKISSTSVFADFEDMFLFDGERQLKIKYNPKVSSFKATVLETKTDTIGGQYPFIFRNGDINYKEFSISGLLSYLSDSNALFLSDSELGLTKETMGLERVALGRIPVTNLESDNIALERAFKLKVLEWLTNGIPKLFRSPAEGNYIVRTINHSLSPNDTVGRMLHTFSCTAYEIAENSFENLVEYGFVHKKVRDNEFYVRETGPLSKFSSTNLLNKKLAYFIALRNVPKGIPLLMRYKDDNYNTTFLTNGDPYTIIPIYEKPLEWLSYDEMTWGSLEEMERAQLQLSNASIDIGYYVSDISLVPIRTNYLTVVTGQNFVINTPGSVAPAATSFTAFGPNSNICNDLADAHLLKTEGARLVIDSITIKGCQLIEGYIRDGQFIESNTKNAIQRFQIDTIYYNSLNNTYAIGDGTTNYLNLNWTTTKPTYFYTIGYKDTRTNLTSQVPANSYRAYSDLTDVEFISIDFGLYVAQCTYKIYTA